jgi:hypothetical protein
MIPLQAASNWFSAMPEAVSSVNQGDHADMPVRSRTITKARIFLSISHLHVLDAEEGYSVPLF